MTIVPGGQNFQVDANWKLWHENGMDPFHVHQRASTYFEYSADATKVGKERAKAQGVSTEEFDPRPAPRVMMTGRYNALMQTKTKFAFDLGNGHMAYDYPSTHGRPFAQWHPSWDPKYKAELEAMYEKAVARRRRRTRQEDGAFRPSHLDFSESRDRRQSRHHDPHLFLQEAGGDAGAELDTRAARRNRRKSASFVSTATWISWARPASVRPTTSRRSRRRSAAIRARRITAAGTTFPPA